MLLQLAGVILDSLGVTASSVVEADNSIIHTNVARCALVKCIAAIFILVDSSVSLNICDCLFYRITLTASLIFIQRDIAIGIKRKSCLFIQLVDIRINSVEFF
ncbi:hypothetical protein ESCOCK430B_26835 [Escherichia coli]